MEKQQNSFLPLLIIVGVLLVVVVGGLWFYNSSASKPTKPVAKNPSANSQPTPPKNASPGAIPPNYKGAENSPVVLEEFADFQCPACAATHPKMNEIAGLYGSRIKFIYRNFPLPMHDKSYDAAVAAEAAGMQGKFWDMQNLLFQNQKTWEVQPNYRQTFEEYANTLGLNIEKFKNDMASTLAKQRVDADLQRARSLGVSQTPSLYINGRLIPNESVDVPTLKLIIDAELKNKQAAEPPPTTKPESTSTPESTQKSNDEKGKEKPNK